MTWTAVALRVGAVLNFIGGILGGVAYHRAFRVIDTLVEDPVIGFTTIEQSNPWAIAVGLGIVVEGLIIGSLLWVVAEIRDQVTEVDGYLRRVGSQVWEIQKKLGIEE